MGDMAHDPDDLKVAVKGGVFSLIAGVIAGIFTLASNHVSSREPDVIIAGAGSLNSNSVPISPGPSATTPSQTAPLSSPPTSIPKTPDSVPESLPAALVGRWGGRMVRYGSMNDMAYATILTLANHPRDDSGVIGRSIEFTNTTSGDFLCSYLLRLKEVTTDSVVLTEEALYGDPDCASKANMFVDVAGGKSIIVKIRDCARGKGLGPMPRS